MVDQGEYPERYWHCYVRLDGTKGGRDYAILNDATLEQIVEQVVKPWHDHRSFTVSGKIITDRNKVAEIQITHTPETQRHYAEQYNAKQRTSSIIDMAMDRRTLPITNGEDYTHALLFSQRPSLITAEDPTGERNKHAVFGTPPKSVVPDLCFVLMPFLQEFDEVWQDTIRPTVQQLGLQCYRADNIYGPGVVVHDIWENIASSKLLIADLTGKNPNVFYELGLAHAIEKNVILISRTLDDVPFDLRHHRVVVYSVSGRGLAKLRTDLVESIQAVPR